MTSFTDGKYSAKAMFLRHLGALITIIMWGLSFVSTRVLLDNGMGPAEVYIYRFVLTYLMVLIISHRKIMSDCLRDECLFAVCGLCAGSIYFMAENTALEYTLVSNVSLLTSMSPLITTMLVGMIYRSERPGKGAVIGSLVAFMGVACVIFNSSFSLEVRPLGDFLSLAAAFSWAVYSLVLRKLNVVYDVWFITRKTFFYGILTALPFMFFGQEMNDPMEMLSRPAVIGNLLFLVLGASVLGYVLWAIVVKRMGAIKANNYLYLQPIVTLVASVFLIGEKITVIGYIGCILILGGLWIGDWLSRRWQ